jgi:hypothetical protein
MPTVRTGATPIAPEFTTFKGVGCCVERACPDFRAMARKSYPSRNRSRDTHVLFAVRYEDGRCAYIRVAPKTAEHGTFVVMDVAAEHQLRGEIPPGRITGVRPVR